MEAPASVAFPPRDFTPPSERSAQPGDGVWKALGSLERNDRAASIRPPIIVATEVHPHPDSRWVTVTLAAIDLARADVHLVPGTEDVAWAKVQAPAGLVPQADQSSLLAVMNGGFQPRHGRWGMRADGVTVVPPRDGGCTLVIEKGRGRLGSKEHVGDLSNTMTLRQTPPCIVEDGKLHPDLLVAGRDKKWAGQTPGIDTRRRSALGVDPTGTVLFYAIGEEASARWLAEGLKAAGAVAACETDINWYWTRFLLFGEAEKGELGVTSTLVPQMEHQKTGYVTRPSTRDFFYVVAR